MATLAAVPTVMAVDIPEGGEGRAVSVEWSTGERTSFNVLWLRDNCPSGGDKRSAFRTFSVAELDPRPHRRRRDPRRRRRRPDVLGRPSFDLRLVLAPPAPITERAIGLDLTHGGPTSSQRRSTSRRSTNAAPGTGCWTRSRPMVLPSWSACPKRGPASWLLDLGHVRETDFGRFFDIVSEPDGLDHVAVDGGHGSPHRRSVSLHAVRCEHSPLHRVEPDRRWPEHARRRFRSG